MNEMYVNIRKICDRKGISLRQLSQMADVTPSTFANMNRRGTIPKYDKLVRIADALNVPIGAITGEETPDFLRTKESNDIAEFLYHNPDYQVLFEQVKDVPKEDILFVKMLLEKFNGKH